MQGESHATSSLVIPGIRGLWAEMEGLAETYACNLTKTLQESIKKWLHWYEALHYFHTATALHPGFKLLWCSDAQETADVRQGLIEKIRQLRPDDKDNLASPRSHDPDLAEQAAAAPTHQSAQLQVDDYLEEKA